MEAAASRQTGQSQRVPRRNPGPVLPSLPVSPVCLPLAKQRPGKDVQEWARGVQDGSPAGKRQEEVQGGAPDRRQSVGEGRGGLLETWQRPWSGIPVGPGICVLTFHCVISRNTQLGQVPFSSNPRLSAALETRQLLSLSSENLWVTGSLPVETRATSCLGRSAVTRLLPVAFLPGPRVPVRQLPQGPRLCRLTSQVRPLPPLFLSCPCVTAQRHASGSGKLWSCFLSKLCL